MIHPIASPWEPDAWASALKDAFRSTHDLLDFVGLDEHQLPYAVDHGNNFATLVPQGFAARIRPGNPWDPLLLQVLPLMEERQSKIGFSEDPLQETSAYALTSGLIQKYSGRALMITTPSCAVHCRYCFRRAFPYEAHRPREQAQSLTALKADTSVTEIILSGGDPLVMTDAGLGKLFEQLDAIAHLKRVRIHTRLPIVLPERVTQGLLDVLMHTRLQTVMVVHANHAQELNPATHRAFRALKSTGMNVLNQSVLLEGINMELTAQVNLQEKLHEQGILPYYLHLPDRVTGTHHFFVEDAAALALYREMQAILPGYLLPKLVREVPGGQSKQALATS